MESKVIMFNSDDIKVGETYMRRARQLVSQQRAEWTDEGRSAIRFAPDGELLPETAAEEVKAKSSLYELAEKRIRERKRFWLYIRDYHL